MPGLIVVNKAVPPARPKGMRTLTRPGFEEYVGARSAYLLRFAYLLCGDRHLAEDLVQEVLIKAHRRWSAIEADSPDAYLKQALVRTHVSWLRRRAASEITTATFPDETSLASHDDDHASRDEVWAMLARLPRAQRAVLVLRYFEDLDDARIAELVGVSPSTVRVHAHRGLRTLRETLQQRAGEAPTGAGMLENVRAGAARAASRRRIAVPGAIAVIVAAIVGSVLALGPGGPGGPVPEPGHTVTPTVTPTTPPSPPTYPPLPGTASYLSYASVGDDNYQLQLHRISGGRDDAVNVGAPTPFGNCPNNGPGLSPDGSLVGLALGTGEPLDGNFYAEASISVIDVATGQSRQVAAGVSCWASWVDDATLLVEAVDGGCRLVDISTTAQTPYVDDRGCHYDAFSPGGAMRAHAPVVETAGGAQIATLPSDLPGEAPFAGSVEAFGVSDDGRYVVMGESNTDPGRQRLGGFLYDTRTADFIPGEALLGPAHAAENVTGIYLIGGAGMVVSTYAEATQSQNWYLLAEPGRVTAARPNAPESVAVGMFVYVP